jgi:hypothetical protein
MIFRRAGGLPGDHLTRSEGDGHDRNAADRQTWQEPSCYLR